MNRFFVPPAALAEHELFFKGDQARQISTVLRLRHGEEIVALDNSGAEYRVRLTAVRPELVRGEIIERAAATGEASTKIILYQGLLKADRFEWVLQKGTEVGIAGFVPVRTERAVSLEVRRSKRDRWERIVTEAAEQAHRGRIPAIAELAGLDQALENARRAGGCMVIPWEQEQAAGLREILAGEGTVHLFIGPEGGFTPDEIALARSTGAFPITLGSRILRAETAGLVAASAILFARGDMDARP